MIKAISPSERETFKDALISLFDDDADIPLLASADPDPEPEPSDDAIEDAIETSPNGNGHNGNGHNGNGNGHNHAIDIESLVIGVSDIEAILNKLGINELRKLAKSRSLATKGTKFILIHRLIESGISESDLN